MDMTTKVKAGELIAQLEENLGKHKIAFEDAQKGYVKKVLEVLDDLTMDIRQKGDIDTSKLHRLSKPTSHEADYLQAIKMLKLQDGDTLIELGWDQFRQFWEDEWDWKQHFVASNSMYTGR